MEELGLRHCDIPGCDGNTSSAQEMLQHYRRIHDKDPSFSTRCFYKTCPTHATSFRSHQTLRKHLICYHPDFFSSNGHSSAAEGEGDSLSAGPLIQINEANTYSTEDNISTPSEEQNVQMDSAMFVLRMLEERKMNQTDVQYMMQATNEFVNKMVKKKLEEAAKLLCESADRELVYNLQKNVNCDLFDGLQTQYSQRIFFMNKFGMIPPQKVDLKPAKNMNGRSGTGKSQMPKQESYMTVSLLEQIEKLLQKDDVRQEILRNRETESELYSSFRDGKLFKENELFNQKPSALQIHLYLDEVQHSNPLGSKDHKLCFLFFSLGNLDVKYRSSFKNIHLLSIFYHDQVKTYTFNYLIRPILNELKLLEDGVEMSINGKTTKVFGTLTAFLGDNLSSHQVGGYKAGFAKGFRMCRYCLGTDEEIQTNFDETSFVIRTPDLHNLHCAALNTQLTSHFSKLYGLNFESVFKELKYAHVSNLMVPDYMHDVFEGVLPLTMIELINYLVKTAKYFSLDQLNHGIKNYEYGPQQVVNKPSLISPIHLKNKSLRQSAAQTWLMAIMLPIIFGPLVPVDDEKWLCFITLLEICRLVCKPTITDLEILKLETLIEHYLHSFRICFDRRLTSKQHFLIHYPRLIRLLGPLTAFWCMRYEAKHAYFKQLTHNIGNFINLPHTLSYRHQQWQCLNLHTSGNNYLTPQICFPNKKVVVPFQNVKCRGQVAEFFSIDECIESEHLLSADSLKWVQIASAKYIVDSSVLLCPLRGCVRFAFGLLKRIYVHNGQIGFLCKMFTTNHFDSHLQAFNVSQRRDKFYQIVSPNDLSDHRIYHLHKRIRWPLQSANLELTYVVTRTEMVEELGTYSTDGVYV